MAFLFCVAICSRIQSSMFIVVISFKNIVILCSQYSRNPVKRILAAATKIRAAQLPSAGILHPRTGKGARFPLPTGPGRRSGRLSCGLSSSRLFLTKDYFYISITHVFEFPHLWHGYGAGTVPENRQRAAAGNSATFLIEKETVPSYVQVPLASRLCCPLLFQRSGHYF